MTRKILPLMLVLMLISGMFTPFIPTVFAPQPVQAAGTNWCVAGDFNGWNNGNTPIYDDGTHGDLIAGDDIYSLDYTFATAGRQTFKAVECGNWSNAFPSDNAWIITSETNQTVKLTFDTNDYTGNAGAVYLPQQNIVNVWGDTPPTSYTVVGPWQGWNNSAITTTMTHEGQGFYRLAYEFASAGSYEAKISQTGNWDNQFGADGRNKGAPTIPFTTTVADQTMVFLLDSVNGRMLITPEASTIGTWCLAGEFNGWSEAGFPLYDDGTNGDLLGGDGVFSLDFTVPISGTNPFKVNTCAWATSYPSQNAWVVTVADNQVVKFTFDSNDHSADAGLPFMPTQHIVNAHDDMPTSFTVVGPWQGWDPDNITTTMTHLGNNVHILNYTFATAGDYEAKATATGAWAHQVGGDGRSVNAPTIPFTVANDDDVVSFVLDGRVGRLAIFAPEPILPPIDLSLVRAPISHTVQDEQFYFLLTDRFEDGDPTNNTGGIAGDHFAHGYLPTHKNFFHGGDFAGISSRLDYLEDMGVTALWITPIFENDVLEGSGTDVNTTYAAHHGYWILDYETTDPHLGTDVEFAAFVAAAHARGIKVYLDIVANHTGNVIQYLGGQSAYRNKENYPYQDADSVEFDDRDYVGTGTFPDLDPAISFPYVPTFTLPSHATLKNPDWLNNPIYYHNRGDSSFSGESNTYGDFFGLDDLFTEHPDVVLGFIDIFTNTIANYNIDGYRIDTVKHVNIEFWQEVIPAVMDYAVNNGKPDFFMFGEVFEYSTPTLSTYTTRGKLPSVLDFQLQGYTYGFAIKSEATSNLQTLFANDDYYTDADSNAYQLANFIGNHDIGRFGGFIRNELGGTPDAEWLARSQLGHALLFFARGFPIVYYGDEQGFVSDGGSEDAREDMFPSQVAVYNDNVLIGTSATTADDNFDNTHPLYLTLADYATVRGAHEALRRGAQIHRYGQGSAGIYAFSRIERAELVEYVVALNNAETPAAATFPVYTADMGFTAVYPLTSTEIITSDGSSQLSVTVPPLSLAIYRANGPLAGSPAAPDVAFTAPLVDSEITGRVEVGVTLSEDNIFAEVNFAVKIGDDPYEYIGTDNNPPYRVFYDVSGIPDGTPVTFQAIVNDLNGHYKNNIVNAVVSVPSSSDDDYVIIHYRRPAGDYGDYSSSDFNDFWGLHLWGSALHADEYPAGWDQPRKFSGFDDYGAYVALRLVDETQPVNFIIHRGNDKDPGNDDRSFSPAVAREVWLLQGTYEVFTSKAEALGQTLVHYHRADDIYTNWGLHLWQAAALTTWPDREMPSSYDDFGAVYSITTSTYPTLALTQTLNLIPHNGAGTQEPERAYTPAENYEIWIKSADAEGWYAQEGAATNVATIHYHRCLGDYGDYTSSDFNDFWGLHTWGGAANPGWTTPRKADGQDAFGVYFDVPLNVGATELNYILHRGGLKDVPDDQNLNLGSKGYEIWIVEGDNGANLLSANVQFTHPAIALNIAERVCSGVSIGDITKQRAYWLSENTIGWNPLQPADVVYLHAAPTGGLTLDNTGISGGTVYTLTRNGAISGAIAAKFPHLTGIAAWEIDAADLADVPDLLKGQIAVSAFAGGALVDATGLQIPGVLDDLYTYAGPLGVTYSSTTPTLSLWAPTAQNVTLHVFADAAPATASMTYPMMLDPDFGVWSVVGDPSWNGQYYLYEVEVYVHSTGQVEHNIVTDPYAISLAMNSTRSQIVDLSDPALAPAGWDTLAKPELVAPEDISVYELHVRDFSVNDTSVPEAMRGTFKAFTLAGTNGVQHLQALADAGLSHLHLLPVFDIATINEDRSQWQEPDWATLASYPPTSTMQQQLIAATGDQDGFNWGYDPFHYNVPEGSYSTVPTGTTRVVEFREMVQSLNEMGLRVVVDVVYNHTNAAGQSPNSVLDRVVPGYYHRLNSVGQVESSTCCANTASEHAMMERLMVDSVVLWATQYKVDAFRFDLMGHHMKSNMLNVRAALDALTLEDDGVDGSAIYLYGEGWNFGEVADNARGVNATQMNMAGTGIGTFSDRLRDAVRGGGPFDGGNDLIRRQGFISGLYYDPNALNTGSQTEKDTLLLNADQIRVGLAGNLAAYTFVDRNGDLVTGAQVDYNGSPTGYTQDPQEHIVYISKHDNQTLYDINQYKMPEDATMNERVRAQNVGLSIVTLSQGVPFLHAGSDMLRSKSMDRDSYNSGDWFNKLDFTYQDNNWGVGLPIAEKNQENWPLIEPRLANPALYPTQTDILSNVHHLQEMLAIRQSSPLFRLHTLEQVQAALAFHNTGPEQIPGLIVMSLTDVSGQLDPNYGRIVVLFNATDEPVVFTEAALMGAELLLHPVQQASHDPVVRTAAFDAGSGAFTIPARTTAVFVEEPSFSVTVVIDPSGAGTVTQDPPSGPFYYGDTITLTAVPADHWRFVEWGGDLTSADATTVFTITGNTLITATFAQVEYTLSVVVDPLGAGTVTQDPSSGPFYYGDTITLTAEANPGWAFASWSDDLGSDLTTVFTITGNTIVTATFTQLEYTLAVLVDPLGSGTVDVTPAGPYHYGDTITLTAEPAVGWAFTSWSGDLTGAGDTRVFTITQNMSVTAVFTQTCVQVSGVNFAWMPEQPLVGEAVQFTADVTTGTAPLTYVWDFGDATTLVTTTLATTSHTFPWSATAESYTVTLQVFNACTPAGVQTQHALTVTPRTIYLPLVMRDVATVALLRSR